MNILDRYAYRSKIAAFSAGEKLAFAGVGLIFCLALPSLFMSLSVFIIMGISSVSFGCIGLRRYCKMLAIPVTFMLMGIMPILFSSVDVFDSDTVFSITIFGSNIGIINSSVEQSVEILLRALGSVACFYFVIINTPMNNLFAYLQKIKVSPVLVDLMELIYRFSFLIFEEAMRIRVSQLSRMGYSNFRDSVSCLGTLISMLFQNCMHRVDVMNKAMQSRCFDGRFSFLIEEKKTGNTMRIGMLLLFFVLAAIAVFERIILCTL